MDKTALSAHLLDARRSEVYGAIFEGGTEWQRITEDLCLSLDAFIDHLDTHTSPELHY